MKRFLNRMLLLAAMLLFIAPLSHARYYALCVGINNYAIPAPSLRLCVNDAQTMKKLFSTSAGALVSMLVDGQATCDGVVRALASKMDKAGKNDVAVFSFSGHGTEEGLVCHDGILPFSKVLAVMKRCKARKKLILVDACHSGKMREDNEWRKVFEGENVIFFLSSRSSEYSLESQYANGLFTIFIDRGLRGGADVNKDRTITARELYKFVHDGVSKASNGEQHPVMWGKFNANTSIVKWKKDQNKRNQNKRNKTKTKKSKKH